MQRNELTSIACLKVGDRIRLISMTDDPDPIPAGTTGTVSAIHVHSGWAQLEVDWDCGRQLMLALPQDRYEILQSPIHVTDLHKKSP